MVQEVRLRLSVFNVILPAAPLEDVVFRVPELADISDAIVENTLDRTALDEELAGFVDDVADEIQQATIDTDALVEDILTEVETRVSELVIDAQDVADLVVDQLNLEDLVTDQVDISGVFGPLTDDVVRAFEEILNDLRTDLEELQDLPQELEAVLEEALADLDTSVDLPPGLEDPIGTLLDAAEAFVLDRLDAETEQEIEALAEILD